MNSQVSSILLGVDDMDRSKRFYTEGLGWQVQDDYKISVFFVPHGGSLVGFYRRDGLAGMVGASPGGGGFSGVVFNYVVRSEDRVDEVLDEANKAGGQILKPAATLQWGGYGGSFADPDGYIAQAAEFLGIWSGYGPWRRSSGRVYSPAGLAGSLTRQQPDPLSFENGLKTLTRELDDPGTPLVNYQRRRQALETWSISEDIWPKLAARRFLMARPESGDRKRHIASVYIWTRVTSGEPAFAPRPIEAAQPPEVQEDWRQSWDATWRDLRYTSDPRSHYARFRAELDAFAAALATAIDTTGHTHLKVASTRPPTITGANAIYSWEPDLGQPSVTVAD